MFEMTIIVPEDQYQVNENQDIGAGYHYAVYCCAMFCPSKYDGR
jgi:hypothetical protein